jgi:hypothetical protein
MEKENKMVMDEHGLLPICTNHTDVFQRLANEFIQMWRKTSFSLLTQKGEKKEEINTVPAIPVWQMKHILATITGMNF